MSALPSNPTTLPNGLPPPPILVNYLNDGKEDEDLLTVAESADLVVEEETDEESYMQDSDDTEVDLNFQRQGPRGQSCVHTTQERRFLRAYEFGTTSD